MTTTTIVANLDALAAALDIEPDADIAGNLIADFCRGSIVTWTSTSTDVTFDLDGPAHDADAVRSLLGRL